MGNHRQKKLNLLKIINAKNILLSLALFWGGALPVLPYQFDIMRFLLQ
jgi:hypothetical protein